MRRLNTILATRRAATPVLRVVDLAGWVRRWRGGELDAGLRPDGVHFDENVAANEVSPWLSREILRETNGR